MHVQTKPRSSSPVLFLRLLSREYMLEEGDMDEDDSDDDDDRGGGMCGGQGNGDLNKPSMQV